MHDIIRQLEKARNGSPRRWPEAYRQPAQEGQADGPERIELLARPGSFEEWDMFRNTAASISAWIRWKRPERRRRRLRHDQRPLVFVFLAGLHGLRRLAVGNPRREDLQGHGPGDEGRRAGDRLNDSGGAASRKASPPRRLCRRVPAQRDGLRRRAADLDDHGPCAGGAYTRRR